ncbi:MAG: Nif3-like dinuclear metal center hexameric protein [Candidatus Bipolaricaulota bacterium]
MNTQAVMDVALELAGMREAPADSSVYVPGEGLQRALVGIDLDEAELVVAKQLGYDLAIAHHPAGGTAVLHYHRVLERHVDQMMAVGVPQERARAAVEEMIYDRRAVNAMRNYDRAPAVARMLDIAYMNVHTPLDEIGRRRMAGAVAELSPAATVRELIAHLEDSFGEFRNALTDIGAIVGDPDSRMGHVVVAHGAGTNGGYPVAKAYFDYGVDTVIYIHCRPQDARRLVQEYKERNVNLVVTGHMSSDSVGINPFVEKLRERGMEVTASLGVVPG